MRVTFPRFVRVVGRASFLLHVVGRASFLLHIYSMAFVLLRCLLTVIGNNSKGSRALFHENFTNGNYHGNKVLQPINVKNSMEVTIDIKVTIDDKFYPTGPRCVLRRANFTSFINIFCAREIDGKRMRSELV